MSAANDRTWMARHRRFEGEPEPRLVGKPVHGGEKAKDRRLRGRMIQDGERSYMAYSADELIEIDSLAHHGRPGLPF